MLPRLINGLCLSPFLNGAESPQRYLVEAGARRFVVNFRTFLLIEALQCASEPAEAVSYIQARADELVSEEELLAAIAQLPPALFNERAAGIYKTPIAYRINLIPTRIVQFLAVRAAQLFSPSFIFLFGGAVLAAAPFIYLAVRDSIQKTELGWGTFGLFWLGYIFTALIHELGHASAVARHGVAAGHIGCGLYWFLPIFYTDVNTAWKLRPSQRVLVDLGGIYFQLISLVALTPLAFFGPAIAASRLLILFNLYSVLQNLNPIFKMDGYWILADLARIPNLHSRTLKFWLQALTRGTADRRTRLVAILYGLGVGIYFGYVLALLPGIVRLQLLPRLSAAGAHFSLCAEFFQKADWNAAFGQLGHALLVALFPAILLVSLIMWLSGVFRRSRASVLKTPGASS